MILELKDKLKGSDWSGDAGSLSSAAASGVQLPQGVENEAISALLVLGYSGVEASRAVQAVQTPGLAVEELIRLALRQLVR
jgi:Holliday junction DNA helicase RuvA